MAKRITICPNPKCRRVINNPSINACPHCGAEISPNRSLGLSEEPAEDIALEGGIIDSHEDDMVYEDDGYYEDDDLYAPEDVEGEVYEDDEYYEDDDLYAPEDVENEVYDDDEYYEDDDLNALGNVEGGSSGDNRYDEDDDLGDVLSGTFSQDSEFTSGKQNNPKLNASNRSRDKLAADINISQTSLNHSDSVNSPKSAHFDIDPLTGLIIRDDLKKLLAATDIRTFTAVSLKINYLEDTYDNLGRSCGDKLLTSVSSKLQSLFPNHCCRFTMDRIIVVLNDVDTVTLRKKLGLLTKYLDDLTGSDAEGIIYDVSIGYATGDGILSKQNILKLAGNRMMESYSQSWNDIASHESTSIEPEAYDPNYDHYYDEVLPEILEEIDRIPIQSILFVVLALLFLFSVIVYLIFFL